MPGDVGLVADLIKKLFGFAVDPDGYSKMSREHKLKVIHEAIREAINANDGVALDALFDELRELRKVSGP